MRRLTLARACLLVIGFVFLAIFQNCSSFNGAVPTPVIAPASTASGCENCSVVAPPVCSFNGQSVANNQTVTAYLTSTVASGAVCQSQVRSCQTGSLSGNYAYASCAVAVPAACLFNGATIADGASVTAYNMTASAAGSSCQSEARTCHNGALSGSYAYGSCTATAALSCLFNGQTVASGSSVIGYSSANVPAGQICQTELRTCTNGALSGHNAFGSCVVAQPASCVFNGQTIASGQSISAYSTSSVPFGGTCAATTRTCTNGTLSGSGDFAGCSVGAPAACLINGQTIANGASITLYAQAVAAPGGACAAEVRTCANGTLSGSAQAPSCVVSTSTAFNATVIPAGTSLTSGDLSLYMQNDGNLVLYRSGAAIWNTQTSGHSCSGGCNANFQTDGNLVLYQGSAPYWASNTSGFAGAQLIVSEFAPYLSIQSNNQTVWGGGVGLNFFTAMSVLEHSANWGPAYPGGPNRLGSADFLAQFQEGSPWANGLAHVNVVKFYTQTLQDLTDAELQGIFAFLNRHHLAMSVEVPPIVYAGTDSRCQIEGVTGPGLVEALSQRVQNLGGKLAYISMDEPLDAYETLKAGSVDCGFNTIPLVAQASYSSFQKFRLYFPAISPGDIESGVVADDISAFADAFRAAGNTPLAFFHDDAEPEKAYWQGKTPALMQALRNRQIPYGFIVNAACDPALATGNQWIGGAVGRLYAYRGLGLATPDQYQVQSWCDAPANVLPESSPAALSFLLSYLYPAPSPAGFDGAGLPIYRSVASSGDHLYSGSAAEGPNAGFTNEGATFSLFANPASTRAPVYRCSVRGSGYHFMSNDAACEGQQTDGGMGYLEFKLSSGAPHPLYRCYSSALGLHLMTLNPMECLNASYAIENPIGFAP